MDLREKMENFNKRWNITSKDSYEESFRKFKQRILNIFEDIDNHVTKESITAFCQYYGIKEVWSVSYGDRSWSENIFNRLNVENKEKEFYRLIELIFALDITETSGYRYETVYSKGILFDKVSEAVDLSDVNIAITITNTKEVILYPKGEKELDDSLVNYPLTFLNKESGQHFVEALQFYQAKNPVKSAESLRRSLEEFLRFKLKNSRGLNANITELQKTLKEDKRDPQVRNIILQAFSLLDDYFNENSKHNDGEISDPENEYLIYQIGLAMRYVNRVTI